MINNFKILTICFIFYFFASHSDGHHNTPEKTIKKIENALNTINLKIINKAQFEKASGTNINAGSTQDLETTKAQYKATVMKIKNALYDDTLYMINKMNTDDTTIMMITTDLHKHTLEEIEKFQEKNTINDINNNGQKSNSSTRMSRGQKSNSSTRMSKGQKSNSSTRMSKVKKYLSKLTFKGQKSNSSTRMSREEGINALYDIQYAMDDDTYCMIKKAQNDDTLNKNEKNRLKNILQNIHDAESSDFINLITKVQNERSFVRTEESLNNYFNGVNKKNEVKIASDKINNALSEDTITLLERAKKEKAVQNIANAIYKVTLETIGNALKNNTINETNYNNILLQETLMKIKDALVRDSFYMIQKALKNNTINETNNNTQEKNTINDINNNEMFVDIFNIIEYALKDTESNKMTYAKYDQTLMEIKNALKDADLNNNNALNEDKNEKTLYHNTLQLLENALCSETIIEEKNGQEKNTINDINNNGQEKNTINDINNNDNYKNTLIDIKNALINDVIKMADKCDENEIFFFVINQTINEVTLLMIKESLRKDTVNRINSALEYVSDDSAETDKHSICMKEMASLQLVSKDSTNKWINSVSFDEKMAAINETIFVKYLECYSQDGSNYDEEQKCVPNDFCINYSGITGN